MVKRILWISTSILILRRFLPSYIPWWTQNMHWIFSCHMISCEWKIRLKLDVSCKCVFCEYLVSFLILLEFTWICDFWMISNWKTELQSSLGVGGPVANGLLSLFCRSLFVFLNFLVLNPTSYYQAVFLEICDSYWLRVVRVLQTFIL